MVDHTWDDRPRPMKRQPKTVKPKRDPRREWQLLWQQGRVEKRERRKATLRRSGIVVGFSRDDHD